MRRLSLLLLVLLGATQCSHGFVSPSQYARTTSRHTVGSSLYPQQHPSPPSTVTHLHAVGVAEGGGGGGPRSNSWLGRMKQRVRNKLLTTSSSSSSLFSKRRLILGASMFLVTSLLLPRKAAMAMGAVGGSRGPIAPMERQQAISVTSLFLFLFVVLALLHAAEIAITTLYPWKVREFAEEEEKKGTGRGTFKVLNEDITRVLTTILVTSTACSIFATTIFTHLAASFFGTRGERYGAVALTGLTLFFVELLPKSIGVNNAEMVARLIVPPINLLSAVVGPVGISLTFVAKKTLELFGLKGKGDDSAVSDSELRLIVTGARDSGTIDQVKQDMISGVLNLNDQRVKEIMKPRVEMIAVPKTMSVASVLGVVRESGYSRIPVYEGEIDNIVGIVLAKSVLDFFVKGVLVDDEDVQKKFTRRSGRDVDEAVDVAEILKASKDELSPIANGNEKQKYVRSLTGTQLASRMEKSIDEADLVESCYFVPDTANGWAVLQEMRRRRVHMAIVVDEYGGTEGLVSLEDIVEEVVGEIYDEDDDDDFEFSEDSITLQEDGSFLVRGDADLADCDTILQLNLAEDEALKEFSTLSGFLCMCAGEIPCTDDFVMARGWCFEILHADDKRVLQVKVDRLLGAFAEKADEAESPLRGFLKRKQKQNDTVDPQLGGTTTAEGATGSIADGGIISDSEIDAEVQANTEANIDEAEKIEKMVEETENKKQALLNEVKEREESNSER